jgi:hypothetical protein
MVWRDEEDIKIDLFSDDPLKISAGLRDLITRMDDFDGFNLPFLGKTFVDSFKGLMDAESQLRYLQLLTGYKWFVPTPNESQILDSLIYLLVKHQGTSIAYNFALELKISKNPPHSISQVLEKISHLQLEGETSIEAVLLLVDFLMDGTDQVCQATIDMLAKWPNTPGHLQVTRFLDKLLRERRG